ADCCTSRRRAPACVRTKIQEGGIMKKASVERASLRRTCLVVCVCLLAAAGAASAQQQDGKHAGQQPGQQDGRGGQQGDFVPTPGMIAMMSLGQAGLMGSMFSNEIYGNTQAKIGASRATIGYIEDSLIGQNVPESFWPDFKDRGT